MVQQENKTNRTIKMLDRKDILNLIKQNNGYCPCKLLKNEDTKCICKEFRQQNAPGKCHCGLFIKY